MKPYTVTFPEDLIALVDKAAEVIHMSRAAFLRQAAREFLDTMAVLSPAVREAVGSPYGDRD